LTNDNDDGDVTPIEANPGTPQDLLRLYSEEHTYNLLSFGASPTGTVLHGSVDVPFNIVKRSGVRLAGGTNERIDLMYTLDHYAAE